MTDPQKYLYLLVDDHAGRTQQFEQHVSSENLVVRSVAEAVELVDIKDDLEALDGAIVDFHLNTPKRADYTHLRYPCQAVDCPDLLVGAELTDEDVVFAHDEHAWQAALDIEPVDVTTGMGAMLYIKQHAPNVALYGFCELSADHSLPFLTAAHLWLGAGAINAEYPAADIRRALTSPNPEAYLPINAQLVAAAEGMRRLTDSLSFLTRPAEAFDWLSEYGYCGRRNTLSEFERRLSERFGVRTLESDIYIELMCRWQGALARILKAFNRDTSGWPDLKEVGSARHWAERNPVLEFVQQGDFRTFFTAPDVRAALAYYRAKEKRRAEEDQFGGY
jgi:hypothetical protein